MRESSITNVDHTHSQYASVYSSYEHSFLDDPALTISTSAPATQLHTALPVDIIIETLVSVLLLCAGIVLASSQLKPIQWSPWSSQLERSKEARQVKAFGETGGNPFARLEERPGFMDVRKGKELKR